MEVSIFSYAYAEHHVDAVVLRCGGFGFSCVAKVYKLHESV